VTAVPLAYLPRGSKARVVDIVGPGRGLRERLMQMGLVPGAVVEVLENSRGPVLVLVEGVRIAIGRGMALRVLVEPLGQS